MIAVGTDAYYALDLKDRFDCAASTLVDYEEHEPDHQIVAELINEIQSLRVDICYGPEGRPDLADPVWDLTHNTMIRSEALGGALALWDLSEAQSNDLIAVFENDRVRGIPGRYWIVKQRRVGGTLAVGQWIRTRVSRREGQHAIVTAHEITVAERIFREVYLTPWENDPLQPATKYETKRQLLFERIGSSIDVMVVKGGEGKGAGGGNQFAHWTEILRYEELGVNLEDLLTNHLSTMSQAPESFACGESSGRGDHGHGFDLMQAAHDDPTNGDLERAPDGGWRMIFLASYKRWDAYQTIESDSERAELRASLEEPDRADEKHLVEHVGIPLEHIKWRHWYETNQIGTKNPKRRRALMRQECPILFQDCFQSSGVSEFDKEKIRELMLTDAVIDGPKLTVDLQAPDHKLYDPREFRYARETPIPVVTVRPDGDGDILVWEEPIPGSGIIVPGVIPHRYQMGVDIAEGTEEGNFSVIHLMDRDTKALVAAYRGKARHNELLKIVRLLSRWYNDCRIAAEVNRFKQWTEDLSETDREPLLYARRDARDSTEQKTLDKYGHQTDRHAREAWVENLNQALFYVPQFVRWSQLLKEMGTFRLERKALQRGKGVKSAKDDTVAAAGICWAADRDEPKFGRDPRAQVEASGKSWTQVQVEQYEAELRRAQGASRRPPRTDGTRRQFP